MIDDDISWNMMTFGDILMIYDGRWWYMMIYDDMWLYMLIYDDRWW
jgi:hypothetical protein